MRNHGTRFELVPMRPHDHIGWVFSGPAQFSALAVRYLTEGASLGERLVYVAADPDPAPLAPLTETLRPGAVQISSVAEVYGTSGIVDASRQRATYARVLEDALADGYAGIRVVADNTPLVSDPERMRAWVEWEIVADQFMAENPVTGLCAFDRDRIDVDRLRHLATLHPLSSAGSPEPQFRLFFDDGALRVEGEVDAAAMEQVSVVLRKLPPETKVVVDLTTTTLVTRSMISRCHGLSEAGVEVLIHGAAHIAPQFAQRVGAGTSGLVWVNA